MFDTGRSSTVADEPAALPADLDEMAPGPQLGAVLAGIDVTTLSGHDQIIVLRAWQRQASHAQAHLYGAMTAVLDTMGEVEDDAEWAWKGAAAEIRCALRLTRRAADTELGMAVDVCERLPRVWQALCDGVIDLRRVRTIIHNTSHLDQHTARQVVDLVIDQAPRLTTGQLAAKLRRLCVQADPDDAKQRYTTTVRDRRVVVEASPDGTAHLFGLDLPPHRVAAVSRRINYLARSLHHKDETRTMDQLRADIYLDLLLGGGDKHHRGKAKGTVDIQVDLKTLIRLSEDPGELAGYGPVIADIARQVVTHQPDSQWRYTITDPDTNQPIATGVTRRRPTTPQRRAVQTRDRTCVFPGCRMPATDCDLDHRIPWASGGPTTEENQGPLCRHDHTGRHHLDWTYQRLPNGDYLWTTKLGHQYTTSGLPP